MDVISLIEQECDAIKQLLVAKNKAYGNSFSYPMRVFSRATLEEALDVRIDDKLSRIARGQQKNAVPEDTEQDLIGYLILKRVVRRLGERE